MREFVLAYTLYYTRYYYLMNTWISLKHLTVERTSRSWGAAAFLKPVHNRSRRNSQAGSSRVCAWGLFASLAIWLCFGASAAHAQIAISGINTTTNLAGTPSTESGSNPAVMTFQNDVRSINQFTAGATNYSIYSTANSVAIRRDAANSTNSSTWVTSVNATTVMGTQQNTYGAQLLDNNILQGADNVFSNGNAVSQGNIERIDFLWTAGVTVQSNDGFAVLDRGLAGAHDAFQVAAITSLGSGIGSPLTWTFGNVLQLTSANYGSNLDLDNNGSVDTINYQLMRYNAGDNISSYTAATETGTQGLAGIFIRFADLGIASNTTIYGYAIMGSDVTTNSANLADWSNATFYPTSTADANGGIDLAAFNGRISRVPEPATYGAIFIGLTAVFSGWRRHRRGLSGPAA